MNGTKVEIRPFQETDQESVFTLFGRVFGEHSLSLWKQRWRWQFYSNPAARSAPSRMWVGEQDGAIVGYLAAFPLWVKLLATETVVYFPCDLMVAPEARGQRLGERLIRSYLECPNLLANALAYSPAAGRIYERLGYVPVPVEPIYLRPYNVGSIIRFLVDSQRLPGFLARRPWSWCVGIAGRGIGLVQAVLNSLKKPARSHEYKVTECSVIDASFDDLWQQLAPHFPIAVVRDQQFLKWRLLDDPTLEHTLFVGRDGSGSCSGYIVVSIARRRRLTIGRVTDIFCPPTADTLVRSLLGAGLHFLQEQRVDVVSCLGLHPGIRKIVRRYLYLSPSVFQLPAMVLWKGAPDSAAEIYRPENWHLSYIDGDEWFT